MTVTSARRLVPRFDPSNARCSGYRLLYEGDWGAGQESNMDRTAWSRVTL